MEHTEKDKERCRRCRYSGTLSGGMGICDYITATGKARSAICRGGVACTVFESRARACRRKAEEVDTIPKAKKRNQYWDKDEAYRLYRSGVNDVEIAKKLDVTQSTVCLWRNRWGLPPNRKGRGGDDHGGDGGRVSCQCPADQAPH